MVPSIMEVIQILKMHSSPRPLHYHYHVWLLVWCAFYEMLCWFYARCNGTHTFQKVKVLSHQSTEYLPKILGIIKIFLGKCETSLCVVFAQQWLLPWMVFLPSLFLIVESWTLTLIEASEACSCCSESQSLRNGFITLSRLICQLCCFSSVLECL